MPAGTVGVLPTLWHRLRYSCRKRAAHPSRTRERTRPNRLRCRHRTNAATDRCEVVIEISVTPSQRRIDVAAVVAALVETAEPLANRRFDDELHRAVVRGLDTQTARTLRWWQRAAVREVRTYVAALVPALTEGSARAMERAAAEFERSDAAWRLAGDIGSSGLPAATSRRDMGAGARSGFPSADAAGSGPRAGRAGHRTRDLESIQQRIRAVLAGDSPPAPTAEQQTGERSGG